MARYLLDVDGFFTGSYDGPGAPILSTMIEPPENATQPLRFIDGAWKIPAPEMTERYISILAFYMRFLPYERMQIRASRKQDFVVDDFMMMVDAAKFIDLDMADTQNGIAYLVSVGLLTVERAAIILGATIDPAERP